MNTIKKIIREVNKKISRTNLSAGKAVFTTAGQYKKTRQPIAVIAIHSIIFKGNGNNCNALRVLRSLSCFSLPCLRSLQAICPASSVHYVPLREALLCRSIIFSGCTAALFPAVTSLTQLAVHRLHQLARLLPSLGFVPVMVFVPRIACQRTGDHTSSVTQKTKTHARHCAKYVAVHRPPSSG